MYKKFTITDIVILFSSIASLIYSEILFFKGEQIPAIFIGLWVPSILALGIYLKLIQNKK